MNRTLSAKIAALLTVPRASGDEPHMIDEASLYSYLFPAPAGMNRSALSERTASSPVPRASGDEPGRLIPVSLIPPCSPRQRG